MLPYIVLACIALGVQADYDKKYPARPYYTTYGQNFGVPQYYYGGPGVNYYGSGQLGNVFGGLPGASLFGSGNFLGSRRSFFGGNRGAAASASASSVRGGAAAASSAAVSRGSAFNPYTYYNEYSYSGPGSYYQPGFQPFGYQPLSYGLPGGAAAATAAASSDDGSAAASASASAVGNRGVFGPYSSGVPLGGAVGSVPSVVQLGGLSGPLGGVVPYGGVRGSYGRFDGVSLPFGGSLPLGGVSGPIFGGVRGRGKKNLDNSLDHSLTLYSVAVREALDFKMLKFAALACLVLCTVADSDYEYSTSSDGDYYPKWGGGNWDFGGSSGISVGGGVGGGISGVSVGSGVGGGLGVGGGFGGLSVVGGNGPLIYGGLNSGFFGIGGGSAAASAAAAAAAAGRNAAAASAAASSGLGFPFFLSTFPFRQSFYNVRYFPSFQYRHSFPSLYQVSHPSYYQASFPYYGLGGGSSAASASAGAFSGLGSFYDGINLGSGYPKKVY
ncbi:shematrin-like protein 2 [Saccostrea cucullata]|uniref:shematrin-like protein 2 n=1 Tax=Saccostrea cuccullata TaxID=36930 RepID=UPI002ED23D84